MGWRCFVDLYVPPANLAVALQATAQIVVPTPGPPCAVALPNGQTLHLPFAFEPVLKIPPDEVTNEWWDEEPVDGDDGRYIELNAVRLTIESGERFSLLRFGATNNAASFVLFESRSAHQQLLRVLDQAGGHAGVILTDTVIEVRDLANPDRVLEVDWDWVQPEEGEYDIDRLAEQIVCQVSNPFHSVAVEPAWRTTTVMALVRGIDAKCAFDRCPILADALQDAGCDNEAILGHLRAGTRHYRGCWVLNLLRGKE